MTSTSKPQGYLPFIDGLRAIAVLSVFVYHLEPGWLPGGFTGVDVFFVISGFVISGSLDNRGLRTFPGFVSYFYSRRIKRIMPALLACVIVSAIAFVLFSVPGAQKPIDIRDTALSSLFGFSNFVLYGSEQGYFAPSAELNPFTHTWSLGVEEQFYLLFPFIFFWWARENSSQRQRLVSSSLFAVGLLASLIIAWLTRSEDGKFAFYMLPARFWELACGVLIYQLHASQLGSGLFANWRFQLLAPISAILVALGFVFSDKTSFPVPWALLPVIGTVGLIVCLLQPDNSRVSRPIKQLLASKPMVYIGQRSYSMYLWHWPVLVMFRWTIGLDNPTFKTLAVLLTLCLTIASFNFVERPIRSSGYLRGKSNRTTLLGGLAVTLLLLVASAATFKLQDRVSLSVTVQNQALWYPKNRPVTEQQRCGSRSQFLPFTQSETNKKYRQFTTECAEGAQQTIFSVGDSHAGHYVPIYRTLAADRPINIQLFTDGGCRFPESIVFRDKSRAECKNLGDFSRREILHLAKPGDVLFLPGNRIMPLKFPAPVSDKGIVSLERMRLELQPFLDRGMHVLLETVKPVFHARANRCSDWFNRPNSECAKGLSVAKEFLLERAKKQTSIYEALSRENPAIHLWQPMSILCPGETCNSVTDDGPLFSDTNHFSFLANKVLYADWEAKVSSITGGAPYPSKFSTRIAE